VSQYEYNLQNGPSFFFPFQCVLGDGELGKFCVFRGFVPSHDTNNVVPNILSQNFPHKSAKFVSYALLPNVPCVLFQQFSCAIHCIPFIPYALLNVSFGCPQVLRHPPCCTILFEMGLISEFLWNSIIK